MDRPEEEDFGSFCDPRLLLPRVEFGSSRGGLLVLFFFRRPQLLPLSLHQHGERDRTGREGRSGNLLGPLLSISRRAHLFIYIQRP